MIFIIMMKAWHFEFKGPFFPHLMFDQEIPSALHAWAPGMGMPSYS